MPDVLLPTMALVFDLNGVAVSLRNNSNPNDDFDLQLAAQMVHTLREQGKWLEPVPELQVQRPASRNHQTFTSDLHERALPAWSLTKTRASPVPQWLMSEATWLESVLSNGTDVSDPRDLCQVCCCG